MKEFNLTEAQKGAEICTRSGDRAFIYKFNGGGERPLIGYFEHDGQTIPFAWKIDGSVDSKDRQKPGDLVMKESVKFAVMSDNGLIAIHGRTLFNSVKEIETATGMGAETFRIVKIEEYNG